DVESICPELHVEVLFDPCALDQAHVNVEEPGAAHWRQLQRAKRACRWVLEELLITFTVCVYQARIENEDATLRVLVESGLALQLADGERGIDRVLDRTSRAIERAALRND